MLGTLLLLFLCLQQGVVAAAAEEVFEDAGGNLLQVNLARTQRLVSRVQDVLFGHFYFRPVESF